jgi:hypothetical protein
MILNDDYPESERLLIEAFGKVDTNVYLDQYSQKQRPLGNPSGPKVRKAVTAIKKG